MVLVYHFILHPLNFGVWHGRSAKCKVWLSSFALRRRLLACLQQARFLIDVTEVGKPIERHDLVHVVNSSREVQFGLDGNNLSTSRSLLADHVVFIALSGL